MGAVYLAQDTQLDRPVALKVARVAAAGSAKLIQRMETEAKAAARIDHPLICKVYDFGEIDGIRFIAMQYVEGEDLKSYLKRVGRQRPPEEAVRWTLQLAEALEAAHEKGIIHRDLKPENVMLNRKGEPVIMDFGLARRAVGASDAGLTQGMIVGTAAYMSPEQAVGKSAGIDHRSDLYALGVMLFEMLTGEWPFTGSAIEVLGQKSVQPAPSPRDTNRDLSPLLANVCQKLISRKKEDRYATCAELAAALRAPGIASHAPSVSQPDESDLVHFEPFEQSPPRRRTPFLLKATEIAGWWRSQPILYRGSIASAGAICLLLAFLTFFRNSPSRTRSQDEVDNADSGQQLEAGVTKSPDTAPAPFADWDLSAPLGGSQWDVVNGNVLRGSGDGWIATKLDYADFELTLDYQLPMGGNSGVFIRATPSGHPDGSEFLEIQLADDNDPKNATTASVMQTGSLWRIASRFSAVNTKPNVWHSLKLRVVGTRVQVEHDGREALDVYVNSISIPSRVNIRPQGRIGLQSTTTAGVRFRNVVISKLTPK